MKEIRVYIVCDEDEKWLNKSNEAFVDRAERDGTVWSLQGFMYSWNHECYTMPTPDYSYIRILEIDTDTGIII